MLRLFFSGLIIAHSSLPIYGTDMHLRACSRAEIRAAGDSHIKHLGLNLCPCAMNQLGRGAEGVWKHPPLYVTAWQQVWALRGLHRHTSSRPLQQLRTDGDGWNKSTQRRVYPTYRSRVMAFTFHSCSDRRGPPLVDAVRCSCESDPAVRSCPLNRLSPAKNHASQLGHGEQ